MVAFHELVAIVVLGMVLGAYVAAVANYGPIGATFGGSFLVSLITFAVVGIPYLPRRWDFPTLLRGRARRWRLEARYWW